MQYLLIVMMFLSCSKDDQFLHHRVTPPLKYRSETTAISSIANAGVVDVLWIIDNSGSMSDIINNVITNADTFLQKFAQVKSINWNMGIVTTDEDENPCLGFAGTPQSNAQTTDAFNIFKTTMQRCFRNGSGSGFEQTFYNLGRHLLSRPWQPRDFPRQESRYLAIIMVTDAAEQTRTAHRDPKVLLNELQLKYPNKKIIAYGAFRSPDMASCPLYNTDDDYLYSTSTYKTFIDDTMGFAISACTSNFGEDLASISNDIKSKLVAPAVFLNNVPVIETIQVFYEGKEVVGGGHGQGQSWYFDLQLNSIIFLKTEFLGDDQIFDDKEIDIRYAIDDGYPRK